MNPVLEIPHRHENMYSRIFIKPIKILSMDPYSNYNGTLAFGCLRQYLAIPHNDFLNDRKEKETTENLLCYRPALGNLRRKIPKTIWPKIHTFLELPSIIFSRRMNLLSYCKQHK